ncbi:DUF1294 domain-containing protein [Methanomassiliicoccus luminyensis]|uniref:DUF1294 domain-containing protein n=1 Tax=Methanomassiliicoccus luminyensis TaxID=1080712 RepID=UPI00035D9229|nr:DUF1294 domain-containing protein [Methanomassiliicoccus luminyensis]
MLPIGTIKDTFFTGDETTIAIVLVGFLALNLLAFVQFWVDKRSAIMKRRRTPERTLLLYAVLGPFGAYAGMKLFRHKTRVLKFQAVPLFAIAHLFLAALILL